MPLKRKQAAEEIIGDKAWEGVAQTEGTIIIEL